MTPILLIRNSGYGGNAVALVFQFLQNVSALLFEPLSMEQDVLAWRHFNRGCFLAAGEQFALVKPV